MHITVGLIAYLQHVLAIQAISLHNAVSKLRLLVSEHAFWAICRSHSQFARRAAVGAHVVTIAHAAAQESADALLHPSSTVAAASQRRQQPQQAQRAQLESAQRPRHEIMEGMQQKEANVVTKSCRLLVTL